MKNIFRLIFISILCITLVGCGCSKDDPKENDKTKSSQTRYHFNYDKEMFDNPSKWPSKTFFDSLPKASKEVDDLSIINAGNNKDVYTMTIVSMEYSEFKSYTEKLINEGFVCSKAGYWLPDNEKDLSDDMSQCIANNDGIYIKAYWYKSEKSSYNFQMSVANFDMDAN